MENAQIRGLTRVIEGCNFNYVRGHWWTLFFAFNPLNQN